MIGKDLMNEFLKSMLHLVFPKRCIACDGVIYGKDSYICPDCNKKLKYIEEPVCLRCGRPSRGGIFCTECKVKHHSFERGRFVLGYEQIGSSVYRFKYQNRPEYASGYASIIYDRLGPWIDMIHPDALVPVPIHRKRFIKRGYNQAALLAEELSKLTGIPTMEDLIERARNTAPQKLFDRKHRQINMKKAFIVNQNDVKLGNVIVVDDIYTTGSTIDAVSCELKRHGVNKVYFISITAAGT